ncbi:putative ammonium transporter 1 [Stylophora pistillata]|uniref:putative ammonium transporter 1 n=1 Tax=Stylophora pistillata TaxID=50429 RepID=UPI000C04A183|nr:putative ammonium transporter 1 [Stylophora pistillata]
MADAQFGKLEAVVKQLSGNLDQMFLLIMGCCIFFMQTGFAFLEAGSVRSKNTTNILIKNFLDVFIGAVAYWLFGYAFAFGAESNVFIGHKYFALADLPAEKYSHWFFHFVFAATAATIVSGAMAERTEFKAYLVYSVFLTGFVYPVVTHWAWDGNGWLATGLKYTKDNVTMSVTYQDFAGSGVVHVVGGAVALIGASLVGPRIGRFVHGVPVVISGHTVPKAALGGFIVFFGFLAFNGGSQAAIANEGDANAVALSIVNTVLGGASGALTAMIIKRLGFVDKYWSLLFTINGGLTGMVAMCAGCNVVHPYVAAFIGIIAGMAYVAWSTVMLRVKVDDPLDAVAVHLGGGLWGVLSVPIFNKESGIFYAGDDHSFRLFGWNLLGVLVIWAWSSILAFILFIILRLTKQLRVSEEIELKGLDIPKHGEPAYPLESYGDGWNESPSAKRQTFPFTQHPPILQSHVSLRNGQPPNGSKRNGQVSTPVQNDQISNIEENVIRNPAVDVIKPSHMVDTAF